ncbi:MAG: hypothetical protein ACK5L6_11045 [Anaerorhabdus sp.]|uniref:hypothetical protein n=1 Tax=Anaerorhabdus sp. TaxID=1872524 RepID=UPI003A861F61
MKCFNHESRDAVGTCQICGKALCKECASKYVPCLCGDCKTASHQSNKDAKLQKKKEALIDTNTELIMAFVKGIICAVVLTLIFNATSSTPTPFSISAMFFFVPFGWAFITYIEQ